MMAHPVCLMPVVLMSPLPVWAIFHPSAQDAPLTIPVISAIPFPICAAPVPSRVFPSTHATPSMFPPFSVSLFAFVRFICRVVASFHL